MSNVRRHFKTFPHFVYQELQTSVTNFANTLLFYVIFVLLNVFSPAICKLLNAI